MDSKKLALLCRELADDKKAEDIAILDVRDLSSVTDYFVIASGTSEPHLRAIVDEISDRLREEPVQRRQRIRLLLRHVRIGEQDRASDRPAGQRLQLLADMAQHAKPGVA